MEHQETNTINTTDLKKKKSQQQKASYGIYFT